MIQVIRRGAGFWEVTSVREEEHPEHGVVSHYETIGRIAYDSIEKLFFPEDAEHGKDFNSCKYIRQPRGYLTHRGALTALLKPKPKVN